MSKQQRAFDSLVSRLVGNCKRANRANSSRAYARATLLEDLRDGIIWTREQLMAKRAQLMPYLGYEQAEYCDEFLEAIWEAYQEEKCCPMI